MANVEKIVPVQQMIFYGKTNESMINNSATLTLNWQPTKIQKTRPESYKRISTGRVVQDDMNAPLWSECTGMYKSKNSTKDLHSQTWY